ncbi:hypothetical protein NAI73_13365, partial [Francisella tularensis subsp. holarctica]|nr:hypothetical protein [Francisella tularensis subsp. holarctica]
VKFFAQGLSFTFGGPSLMIVVVVMMDFMAKVRSHMMSTQYDSLLKKENLSGKRKYRKIFGEIY